MFPNEYGPVSDKSIGSFFSLFGLFYQIQQGKNFGCGFVPECCLKLFRGQFFPQVGLDIEIGKPAVKGLKTGKAAVFMPAIGKIDLMAKSRTPDGNRISRRLGQSVFLGFIHGNFPLADLSGTFLKRIQRICNAYKMNQICFDSFFL